MTTWPHSESAIERNEHASGGHPWYVIPADHKWVSRSLVARILTKTTESLNLRYPEVSGDIASQSLPTPRNSSKPKNRNRRSSGD